MVQFGFPFKKPDHPPIPFFSIAIRKYLFSLGVPNGIKALGFKREDIPKLVKGALPQVCPPIFDFLLSC